MPEGLDHTLHVIVGKPRLKFVDKKFTLVLNAKWYHHNVTVEKEGEFRLFPTDPEEFRKDYVETRLNRMIELYMQTLDRKLMDDAGLDIAVANYVRDQIDVKTDIKNIRTKESLSKPPTKAEARRLARRSRLR